MSLGSPIVPAVALALAFAGCVGPSQTTRSSAVLPSSDPPAALAPREVPQFVCLGSDDNGFSGLDGSGAAGGMHFLTTLFAGRVNPPGRANPLTYDGCPAHFSFYVNTHYLVSESGDRSRGLWRPAAGEPAVDQARLAGGDRLRPRDRRPHALSPARAGALRGRVGGRDEPLRRAPRSAVRSRRDARGAGSRLRVGGRPHRASRLPYPLPRVQRRNAGGRAQPGFRVRLQPRGGHRGRARTGPTSPGPIDSTTAHRSARRSDVIRACGRSRSTSSSCRPTRPARASVSLPACARSSDDAVTTSTRTAARSPAWTGTCGASSA